MGFGLCSSGDVFKKKKVAEKLRLMIIKTNICPLLI